MHGDPLKMGLTETSDYSPGTARKLRQKLHHLFRSKADSSNNNGISSVIETDYLQDCEEDYHDKSSGSGTDTPNSSISDCSYDDLLSDPELGEDQWTSVCSALRARLLDETTARGLEMMLPRGLLERVSRDVCRMSVSEPYGLRGCSLHLNLDRRNSHSEELGVVECDELTVSTFELHLTLSEDKKRWYNLRDLIAPVLPGCLNESHALEVFISPGYKLVKHKLYRHN